MTTATAGVAVLMVFAFLPGTNATPTAGDSSSGSTLLWAYGQTRSVTIHPLTAPDGWQYEGSVKMGYSVILSQTNGTDGPDTIGLSIGQAEGVSIALEFCRPTCSSPLLYANLSMRAWERSNTTANFTTNGSVEESGASVPALALLDANSTVRANVTESTFSALRSTPGGPIVDRSKYLSAAVTSHAGVAFSPALGLVPLGVASLEGTNATWSSNSSFSASGSVVSTYYYAFHGPVVGNLTFGPATVSRTFQPSGNVSIEGSLASPSSIVLGSLGSFPAIQLSVNGPFEVEDGIVLLPSAADFFGSAARPWTADQATSAVTQVTALDFAPEFDGHLGVAASARSYSLASANPANLTSPAATNNSLVGASEQPATTNPVTSTTLQGEPLAVPEAESNSNCIISGVGCSTGASAPRALLATFGVAFVVVAAAALIGAVVIVDRRRLPPPLYPNATLYPPGRATGPAAAPPAKTPEPPPEDDPLDHLW